MPKVSVIIPVYNVEKYLRQCLDSVVNQTLQDIEIICIDDCSTDNSLTILKEYAQKDTRIKIIEQKENQGQGIARNIAIDITQGEYIMFLDPDDWLELNACELAYNKIYEFSTDICFFDYYNFNNSTKKEKIIHQTSIFEKSKNPNKFSLKDINTPYMKASWSCIQIYNAKFIKNNKIQFSNTRSCEDVPFTFKAMILADYVSILDKALYHYRKYYKGIKLSTDRVNIWNEVLYNKKSVIDFILDSGKSDDYLSNYLIYVINTTFNRYKPYLKVIKNKEAREKMFQEFRNFAIFINDNFDIENIKRDVIYSTFNDFIVSNTYSEYRIRTVLYDLFSIRNEGKHIVISILGLKIKIRRK